MAKIVIGLPDLVHAALYVNRYILQDPLFELTVKRPEAAIALTKGGFVPPPPTDGELDVERVRAIAKFMKELTPMVSACCGQPVISGVFPRQGNSRQPRRAEATISKGNGLGSGGSCRWAVTDVWLGMDHCSRTQTAQCHWG